MNSAAVARFEGGTDPVPVRLAGLAALARAGYPVGMTIAPIMPVATGGRSTAHCSMRRRPSWRTSPGST